MATASTLSALPIDVESLLYGRGVEFSRIEYKAGWDESAPRGTATQVIHTICAFANDLQNLNGGYVVLGVEAEDGRPVLPPRGLDPGALDGIQQRIRVLCKNWIAPEIQPVLSPELVDGRHILVIWVPGSDIRPHEAAEVLEKGARREFYVRTNSDTVKAQHELRAQLLALTAKVPFDDRRNLEASVDDISEPRVRRFLRDVRSRLEAEREPAALYRKMKLVARVNGHHAPRNVGLLCFADEPTEWFSGARIEVVQFAGGSGGRALEERVFRGSLIDQARDCLAYLRNLSSAHYQKHSDRPETTSRTSYPMEAYEEAIVNALYHRSYDGEPEPTKVYLYPDRMVITSYPGPVAGLQPQHLRPGAELPMVPARNRRIGEVFKELQLAEMRGSGVPTIFESMQRNGSPPPRFEFDEARTYFSVILPVHPEYLAIMALRDAAGLRAVGDTQGAIARLEEAFRQRPSSGVIAAELIEALGRNNHARARETYAEFLAQEAPEHAARVFAAYFVLHGDHASEEEREKGWAKIRASDSEEAALETALRFQDYGLHEEAHRLFEQAEDGVRRSAAMLQAFALCKLALAKKSVTSTNPAIQQAGRALLSGAHEMLKRSIQLASDDTERARAWFLRGEVLEWLDATVSEIDGAYAEAYRLAPAQLAIRDAALLGRRSRGRDRER